MLAICIIFKILAVPLFLIVGTVELLFKFLTNLSSYVIGPLMFFIIGWDILVPVHAGMDAMPDPDRDGSGRLLRDLCGSCNHCSAGACRGGHRRIHPLVTYLQKYCGMEVLIFLAKKMQKTM